MKYFVIVDGYKFSKAYASRLQEYGYSCIYIQSSKMPITWGTTYNENDYAIRFNYNDQGGIPAIIEKLNKIQNSDNKIEFVIGGTESGVMLADEIRQKLKLPYNEKFNVRATRSKFELYDLLKKAKIDVAPYAKFSDVDALIEWVDDHGKYPVVLKPISSIGTEDVYICENRKIVIEKARSMLGKVDRLGDTNTEIIVMEFLKGTEYVVNTASSDGEHRITDIWRCHKTQLPSLSTVIYDREELVASEGETQQLLVDYVKKVLNALGVEYGAGHAEVMFTENGPRIIEIGGRVGGGVVPEMHTEIIGQNQLDLMIDAYVAKEEFLRKINTPYVMSNHASMVILSSKQSGLVDTIEPLTNFLDTLKTCRWRGISAKRGKVLEATKDLDSTPGKVILVGDEKEVATDHLALKQFMDSGKAFVMKRKNSYSRNSDPFSNALAVGKLGFRAESSNDISDATNENKSNVSHGLDMHG